MSNANERCPVCGEATLRFFRKVGKYRCINDDCGEEVPPDQLHAAPHANADDLDLDSLPFPVAYPLAHAGDTRLAARDRAANAIFAGYQAMRATALLLLADYLACDTVCRQLQGPIRGLRLPHWYDWSLLCDQLAKFWSGRLQERPERASAFPDLVAAWLEVNRHGKLPANHPWSALLAGLPGQQGPAAQSLNDALWKARNDRAHREATRTVEEGAEQALLPRLLAVSEAMVQRLFPAGELTLWRRIGADTDPPEAIRLQGAHADLRFAIENGPEVAALGWGASGLLASTAAVDLPVYPLFVPLDTEGAEHGLPGGGLIEPVGLIDGIGAKKIAVLGVRSHCELPELVGPIQAGLALKEVQLGVDRAQTQRWSLVSWAAVTAEDTLNALRGRKYFPEAYLERAGVDGLLKQVLDQPGRGLLLLGEAGSGKSSLLARLVDGLLTEQPDGDQSRDQTQTDALGYLARRGAGDVVLFLSGAEAYKGDAAWSGRQTLCEAVLRRAGIASGAFTDLDDLCRHLDATAAQDLDADRRVWLILDALNEADRFTDLLKALDDFLPALERHPWLRLVVSLRSGAYQSLAQRHRDLLQHGSEVLANARYLASFSDPRDKEVPYLELRPFAVAEAREAYELHQQRRPAQSCPVPFDRLEPSLRELVRAPLYLYLFHETFRGRSDPPSDLDEGRLLGAYLDRLQADLPGIAGHLQRLGALMFERRIPFLPVEEADAWIAEWRARLGVDNALRVVKLDPVEELVAASLLMRPIEAGEGADRCVAGYGFSQQRLCEQVLLRELLRQIHPRKLPTADELLGWARWADGVGDTDSDAFDELTGALETVTAALAEQGRGDVLAVLLDLESDAVLPRLLGSAVQALGPVFRFDGSAVQACLAPLVERACAESRLAERFVNSVSLAGSWLIAHGFSPVAAMILESWLNVTRTMMAREPGRAELWQAMLAGSLAGLGVLARITGEGARARKLYGESLEILRSLVEQEPSCPDMGENFSDLRRFLGMTLRELGTLAKNTGDSAGARKHHEESLEIFRGLVKQDPARSDWRSGLSDSLSSLGTLAQAMGEAKTGRRHLEASLEIERALVADEPESMSQRRDLAMALVRFGQLVKTETDTTGARGYFEESLEILRALAAQAPGRSDLRRNLAVSLDEIGDLAKGAGGVAEARKLSEESLQIRRALVAQEPERTDLTQELAQSLFRLGRFTEVVRDRACARSYLDESLGLLRTLVEQEPERTDLAHELAVSLHGLGSLATDSGDTADARRWYEEALEIDRAMVAREPAPTDLSQALAASLDVLGRLSLATDDQAGARGYHEESYEIMRALVTQAPERSDLRRDLAAVKNNLGELAYADGDAVSARCYLEESLAMLRDLVARKPGSLDLRQRLACTLRNLASLAEGEFDNSEARKRYQESLQIWRTLVEQEPERTDLRHELAGALIGHSRLARNTGDEARARGYLEEALKIMRALVAQEPERWDLRDQLAKSLEKLGDLAKATGDLAGAQVYCEESLEIRRALVAQEPERWDLRDHLAESLSSLGKLAKETGDGSGARVYYEESLEIRRALVEREPERLDLRRNLARTLELFGDLAAATGDATGVWCYLDESLEIQRALVAQEPERSDLKYELASSLRMRYLSARLAADEAGTGGFIEESIRILRSLEAQAPDRANLRRDLAGALIDHGELARNAGDEAQARGALEEALKIMRALVAQEPERWDLRDQLAKSLSSLGKLAKETGDSTAARIYFEESLKIRRAIVVQRPGWETLWQGLAMTLVDLHQLAGDAGDWTGAKGYLEESFEVRRALLANKPGRSDLKRDLSKYLSIFGAIEQALGDAAGARAYFEELLEILRALVAQDPERSDLRSRLAKLLVNLGSLAEDAGDESGARGCYEESLEILRALVAMEPDQSDLKRTLAVALNNVGQLALAAGDEAGAQGYFQESLQSLRTLVTPKPEHSELTQDLSASANNLGRSGRTAANAAGARGSFEESLEVMRALAVQEPERLDLRKSLAKSLFNLGSLAQAAGDEAVAVCYFEESLKLLHALVAQYPKRADIRIGLAKGFWNRYEIASPTEKRECLLQVLETLHPLSDRKIAYVELGEFWRRTEQALRDLD